MNKLLNLLIIFIALKFFLPLLISNIHAIPQNLLFINLATSLGIFLIQFIYNYLMKSTNIKQMTLKENIYNSLFKGLIVFAGSYIYEDIKSIYNINIPGVSGDNTIKSIFIIFIMTIFILTKCLITP